MHTSPTFPLGGHYVTVAARPVTVGSYVPVAGNREPGTYTGSPIAGQRLGRFIDTAPFGRVDAVPPLTVPIRTLRAV